MICYDISDRMKQLPTRQSGIAGSPWSTSELGLPTCTISHAATAFIMWRSQPSDQHASLGCHVTPPLLRNRHYASQLCSRHSGISIAHYEKTWRHPQNQKYIVFHCHHSRTEPQPWITSTENFVKFERVVFEIYTSGQWFWIPEADFKRQDDAYLNELVSFYRGPWQLCSRLLLSWHLNADDLRVCNLLH